MDIKKKLASAVTHVKAHPGLYGYIAGCVVTATGSAIIMHNVLKDAPLMDMERAAARILDEGLKGLYWETSKGTMLTILNETLENPITNFKS
jgi:hypothetical protein